MVEAPSSSLIWHNCPSETRSPDGENADVGDVFNTLAEWLLVASRQIVALLPDQDLPYRLAADRGLHSVLHVADVDSEAIGRSAIHYQVYVGCPRTWNVPRSATPGIFAIKSCI